MLAHLGRLGGVIRSPQRTLRKFLWRGEGRLWDILPWLVVVTGAVAPTRAGRAVLLGRVDVIDGLLLFGNLVANRMLYPLLGLVVAASILHLMDRVRHPSEVKVGFDIALDTVAYTLIPYLLLAAVGAGLSALGVDLWFMPHHDLRAPGWYGVARVVVAFGWPAALYLFLVREVWRRPAG